MALAERVRMSCMYEKDHCVVTRGARRLFQCNACRKQTSVKAGTIFASSKLPLRIWFKTIYLVTQSKKGISSSNSVDALASPRRLLG